MSKVYAFVSISDRRTCKSLGVCIIPWKKWNLNCNEAFIVCECMELGLIPEIDDVHSLDYLIFPLSHSEFLQQEIESNRFYTSKEMADLEFEKIKKLR